MEIILICLLVLNCLRAVNIEILITLRFSLENFHYFNIVSSVRSGCQCHKQHIKLRKKNFKLMIYNTIMTFFFSPSGLLSKWWFFLISIQIVIAWVKCFLHLQIIDSNKTISYIKLQVSPPTMSVTPVNPYKTEKF